MWGYARAVRNLPAFPAVRKALLCFLWGGGATGWALAAWRHGPGAEAPPVEIERGGATLGPLWDEACPPAVASRKGKRYYWAWCEGAAALKPANVVRFCGAGAAEAAGFLPAAGCVGGEGEGPSPP